MRIEPFRDFETGVYCGPDVYKYLTPMNTKPIGDFDPALPTTFSHPAPDGGFRIQPAQDFWKADILRQYYGGILRGVIAFEEIDRPFVIAPKPLTDEEVEEFKQNAVKVCYEDPHFGDKSEFWANADGEILITALDVKK